MCQLANVRIVNTWKFSYGAYIPGFFKGDLHACYPVFLESLIGDVRMAASD